MRTLVLLALLALPAAVGAQATSGLATAIDGDSLEVGGIRVRLFGIDAPEASQTCERGGEAWHCGQEAAMLLRQLVARGSATCAHIDTDAYGRSVASCTVGRIDLADAMARAGLAVPLTDFSDAYVGASETARMHNLGIWAGSFEQPADYRARQPASPPLAPRRVAARDVPQRAALVSRIPAASVYFRNCAASRAAGAAPLYRGDAGYRAPLDADNDGIACEPFRGR